jgi:hypothetical protein
LPKTDVSSMLNSSHFKRSPQSLTLKVKVNRSDQIQHR